MTRVYLIRHGEAEGNIFRYVVAAHEMLEPYDVEKMLADAKRLEDGILIDSTAKK